MQALNIISEKLHT